MFVWNKVNLKVKINDINTQSKQAVKGTKSLLNKLISIQTPNLKIAQMYNRKHAIPERAFKRPETKMRLKEELKSFLAPNEVFPNILNKYSIEQSILESSNSKKSRMPKQRIIHKIFENSKGQSIWLNRGNHNKSMNDVLYRNKINDFDVFSPEIESQLRPLVKGSKTQKYGNKSISTKYYFLNYTPLTKKIKLNRSQLVNINTSFDLFQFLAKKLI